MPDLTRAAHPTASAADPNAITGGGPDTTAVAPPPATAGDRYRLGAEIARGGMGAVCRATDTAFGREVAVKVLLDRYAANSGVVGRFADEARITAQLQHPNIPPVFDLGTLPDGRPFLAMKLIKGDTLDELLRGRSNPEHDLGRLVAAFERACEAVAYAHAHGVVHRDLKPSNVMVGAFGEVQVMDWGLAKVLADRPADAPNATAAAGTAVQSLRDSDDLLTQAGSVLGTPAYMPPEQALGAVQEVDRRSDVFGLGGILAVILTGRPPFVGDSAETSRLMAARGKVGDCFARLDGCGADPELVALAKRCLAPEKDDRPADAGVVAREVEALRQAADDRARRAELDLVKAAGEVAAAAAASAERRKRRRLWAGAAAALVLAVVGGLGAVLWVQRKANADLNAKNEALAAERAKAEQRFDMARKAIAAFHTTIDEQPELGNEAFKPLRKKLLGSAAGFYRELEGLLAGDPDPKARKALADGYFQLAELTVKIGDPVEGLAVYRKALALRRELAASPGADADARLAVPLTLRQVGIVAANTGDPVGALRAVEEARDAAAALAAEAPSDTAHRYLAACHHTFAWLLEPMGKTAEALAEYRKALATRRQLAEAHPDNPHYQRELASTYNSIGLVHRDMGDPAESLTAHQQALAARKKLVDAHPDVPEYQSALAASHTNIGNLLRRMNRPAESLAALEMALTIYQRLADTHPAVTEYQSDLALSQYNIGMTLVRAGRPADGQEAHRQGLAIRQKLADAHPAVTQYQSDLAASCYSLGVALDLADRPADALPTLEQAIAVRQKLTDTHPTISEYQLDLIHSLQSLGNVLVRAGRPTDALAAFERAIAVRQRLADAHPAVTRYQTDLAADLTRLGLALARAGRAAEALLPFDAGLTIRQKLAAADPEAAGYANALGYSHAYRGWARERAGRPQAAADDLRAAAGLWDQGPAPSTETRFEKARTLALLAKLGGDPAARVTAEEARVFADKAVAALADAVKAGFSDAKELKGPDFDAVRDREAFRKLLAEVEAKAKLPAREVLPPPRKE